ncbi:MAG: hypothetical protein Kow0090_01130 [Myxococcota bacterium]
MKALKIIGIIGGIFVGLFILGGVILYLTVDIDKIVNEQKEKFLPEVEKQIGRKVTIGPISTTLLTGIGVDIQDVKVEKNLNLKEDDRPFVSIKKLGIRIDTIKAIVTMGKSLELSAIYVDGLQVNIIRLPDGSMSFDDILKKLAEGAPPEKVEKEKPPEEPAPPTELTKEQIELIKRVKIGYIGMENASFRFYDMATGGAPAESFIKDFDFVMKDIRITDPIKLNLNMAAFAEKQNVFIEVVVGPLPENLKIEGMPKIPKVSIDIREVDLGNISPYLGSAMPLKITKANFSMKYDFKDLSLEKPLPIKGFLELKNLLMEGGKQFDFRVDTDLVVDAEKLNADINKLDLKIGEILFSIKGKFSNLKDAPTFKGFSFETKNLNLSKLISYYPELKKSLPPGFDMPGDMLIDLKADGDVKGQKLTFLFDASKTRLFMKDTVDKPSGEPLKLSINGEFSTSDMDIKDFKFEFGKFNLGVKGTIKDFANPKLNMEIASNKFTMNDIARLVPAVKDNIPPDVQIKGAGELKSSIKGSPNDINTTLDFYLTDVDLKVPDTTLVGDMSVKLLAKGNPESDMLVNLDVNLDKATIFVKDAVNKSSKTPMNLVFNAVKKGERIDISKLGLTFAELNIIGGGWINYASNALNLKLELTPLPLDRWAQTVIALKDAPTKGGVLKFAVSVEGNPNQIETVIATLSGFEFKMGRNSLSLDARVKNPEVPDITWNLSSPYFNLDDIFPPSKEEASASKAEKEEPPPPREDNPFLEQIKVAGKIRFGQFIASEFPIENFVADIRVEKGDVNLDQFSLNTYKGKISGTGTKVNISKAIGPYDIHFSMTDLDVNALLTGQADMKDKLYGRLSGKLDMKGTGTDMYYIKRNATGKLYGLIKNGRYDGANITKEIAEPIVKNVPGAKADKQLKDKGFKKLEGFFNIKNGRLWLEKPMIMEGPDGTMEMTGSIGLDSTLDLTGTYKMSPAAASAMVGGKCKVKEPLPVPLKIKGTADKPKIGGIDASKPAKVLAKACFGKEMEEAVGAAKEKAGEKVKEAKEKVEEKKKEAKEKVKKESKKAKEKAKKKAKEKAKKALGF